MQIRWLGHACFILEESTGTKVMTDPFLTSRPEGMAVDALTISHPHKNHARSALFPDAVRIDSLGAFEVEGIHISSIQSYHDAKKGGERGGNLIFKFRLDGVDVCHLGDIGEECNAWLAESIGSVNVLLVPVGGGSTIDAAAAKEYVDLLMPDIVIPMHYKDAGNDLEKVDRFLELFEDGEIEYTENDHIELDRSDFNQEETKVVVLKRKTE